MLARRCNPCKRLVTALPQGFVLVLALTLVRSAFSAEAACDSAPYRAFDFWLGQWEVTMEDGRRAGRNHITSEQDGCVLVERWQGAQGTTGMSMNFFDPTEDVWRQVWVSPGVEIDISGGMSEGSMVLEGTIVYLKDDRARPFRGTWTPLPDGRVRQYFEEQGEEGEWTPWFEGFYRRLDEPAT